MVLRHCCPFGQAVLRKMIFASFWNSKKIFWLKMHTKKFMYKVSEISPLHNHKQDICYPFLPECPYVICGQLLSGIQPTLVLSKWSQTFNFHTFFESLFFLILPTPLNHTIKKYPSIYYFKIIALRLIIEWIFYYSKPTIIKEHQLADRKQMRRPKI